MTFDRRKINRRFLRGLGVGFLGGLLSFPLPWIVGYSVLNLVWLVHGTAPIDRLHDWANMIRGGWLAAYFTVSVSSASLFTSSFSKGPKAIRNDVTIVAAIACFALVLFVVLDGPRYKSEPSFGEPMLDKLVLTIPAMVTGAVIAIARSVTSATISPSSSPNEAEP